MKHLIISLLFISTFNSFAQTQNQNQNPMKQKDKSGNLTGIIFKENLTQEPFDTWFSPNYQTYKADEEIVEALNERLENIRIKVFIGTWCGDSQDQTPVLYKILDATDFDYDNLELIGVNREKKTPNNLQEGFDIDRVPTFIFYKDNKEIGRIVEYPKESMEADMLTIISGKPYKHSYEE